MALLFKYLVQFFLCNDSDRDAQFLKVDPLTGDNIATNSCFSDKNEKCQHFFMLNMLDGDTNFQVVL